MNADMSYTITPGKYIIINRKSFSKLHLLTDNSTVYLGKDKVYLNGIIGSPFWTTFKMIQKNSKREFTLSPCSVDEINENDELLKSKIKSGSDNRNIWDDGNSQLLSTKEIIELRDSGLPSQAIVGCLIDNSRTFHNKTEYSQEKYLKKKGTKYFEYLTIKQPTIRLLSELFYLKDPAKILGLRMDSLSQIITAVNLQPDGTYLLYENGSQGLVAATILNYLSEHGKLVYITPGKHPQQHAILAMNFSKGIDKLKCISLSKLSDELGYFELDPREPKGDEKRSESDIKIIEIEPTGNVTLLQTACFNEEKHLTDGTGHINSSDTIELAHNSCNILKRKTEEFGQDNSNRTKKPRWEVDAEEAIGLLKSKASDGLILVCKEYPSNLLTNLLNYIKYSRPFVLFNLFREPLAQLYIELKTRHDIVNLRLTETWLRSYQVLNDRTHPNVLMSGNSGHLLTGTIVNNL